MISTFFLVSRINPFRHTHRFVINWTPASPSSKRADEEWASFMKELASLGDGEVDHAESDSDPDLRNETKKY